MHVFKLLASRITGKVPSFVTSARTITRPKNGGALEKAQYLAGHKSVRTIRLYDRRQDEVPLDEVERMAF